MSLFVVFSVALFEYVVFEYAVFEYAVFELLFAMDARRCACGVTPHAGTSAAGAAGGRCGFEARGWASA